MSKEIKDIQKLRLHLLDNKQVEQFVQSMNPPYGMSFCYKVFRLKAMPEPLRVDNQRSVQRRSEYIAKIKQFAKDIRKSEYWPK